MRVTSDSYYTIRVPNRRSTLHRAKSHQNPNAIKPVGKLHGEPAFRMTRKMSGHCQYIGIPK